MLKKALAPGCGKSGPFETSPFTVPFFCVARETSRRRLCSEAPLCEALRRELQQRDTALGDAASAGEKLARAYARAKEMKPWLEELMLFSHKAAAWVCGVCSVLCMLSGGLKE